MSDFDEQTQAEVVSMESYMNLILIAVGSSSLSSIGATTVVALMSEVTEFRSKLKAVGIDETTL